MTDLEFCEAVRLRSSATDTRVDLLGLLMEATDRLAAASDRPLGDPEIGLEIMRLERDRLQEELNSIWDVIRESHISYDDSLSSAEKIRVLVEQLDEARKAATSIYESLQAGEFFMDEIAGSALAKWPWLAEDKS